MIRTKQFFVVLTGFVLIISGHPAGAHETNVQMLNPYGPVPAEEAQMLDAREPITELGGQRSNYLAGSEVLGENEIRIIALGSGMPRVQRAQVSACWLIELGNGDSFIFDIGSRCTINISLLEVPWDTFTKVFLSHLHADHIGDLPSLLADGWDMGRSIPIELWGPSGASPELGTNAMVKHLMGMYRWDYASKLGRGAMSSYTIKVHEFDYSKEQTIYERNGVKINSFPAVHTIDGAVSYSLEWKGMKVSYSGDTVPTKWFLNNAKNSDVIIHECSDPIEVLIEDRGFPPEAAWMITSTAHTQPRLVAEIFKELNPRMAICYHYVANGMDRSEKLYAAVRPHLPGPFMIAKDLMVWNVTPDNLVVRTVVGSEYNSKNLPRRQETPDKSKLIEPSDWLDNGRWELTEIYQEVLDDLKPEYRERILEHVSKEHLPQL